MRDRGTAGICTALIWIVPTLSAGPLQAAPDEPTLEEARALCEKIEASVVAGDPSVFAAALDADAVIERAMADLELSAKARAGVRQGFAQRPFDQALAEQLVSEVQQGGGYDLLRVREVDGRPLALFRLVASTGLNYHELELVRGPDGTLRIPDLYIHASGEKLTQTIRRGLLPSAAQENRSLFERLFKSESEYVKNLPRIAQMMRLGGAGQPAEALAIHDRLPRVVREEKTLMLARIQFLAALMLAEEEGDTYARGYSEALADYLRLFPSDPSVDLVSIDHFFTREAWDDCLELIDAIDARVGGDPYLDTFRGNIAVSRGRYGPGIELLEKVVASCPGLHDTYYTLINYSLAEKDHPLTTWAMKRFYENCDMIFDELPGNEAFAGYVASEEYAGWLAYLESGE